MGQSARLLAAQNLQQQVQSLIEKFSALSRRAEDRIVHPLSQGESPDLAIVDEIRATIEDTRAVLSEALGAGIVEQGVPNLRELLDRLGRIIEGESWAAIREECRPHAERVLRIIHKSDQTPLFVQQLHERARECLEELSSETPPDDTNRDSWEERIRTFRYLWLLLNEPDALDDLQAEEALERLKEEFGLSLVSAITLRRLVVRSDLLTSEAHAEGSLEEAVVKTLPTIEKLDLTSKAETTAPETRSPCTLDVPPSSDRPGTSPSEVPNAPTTSASDATPPIAPVPAAQQDVVLLRSPRPRVSERREVMLDHERCSEIHNLIWQMVAADRLGLAYQLALCTESLAPLGETEPSDLLRAAVLGLAVRSSSGEVVNDLRESVEHLQNWLPRWQDTNERSRAACLVVLGLSLRPTLLAPQAGALSLLAGIPTLDSSLSALGEIRHSIAEFGRLNLELSPGVLKGVRDQAVWQQKLDELHEEARGWLEHNRHANIIYAPTTNVWHRWLECGRPLGQTLEIIVNRQTNRTKEVCKVVREWSDQRTIEKELAKTDEEIRKVAARRRPIEARAQTAICKRVREFVHIAQRWLEILATEPGSLDDFRQQSADRCRSVVERRLSDARAEVGNLANEGGTSAAVKGAARFIQLSLEDIGRLFDPHMPESSEAPSVQIVLGEELLALADIPLDENWQPLTMDALGLLRRLEEACTEAFDLRNAFAKQSEVRNHLGTQRVIEALATRPNSQALVERLREKRDDAVQQCRQALRRKLDEIQKRIEEAVCYDLIDDEERGRSLGVVEECRLIADDVADFASEHRKLERIEQAIADKRQQRIAEVHQKLSDTSNIPADRRADLIIVREALDRGDFLSADEYIELVRKGQPLVRTVEASRNVLPEFFPEFVKSFLSFMEGDGRSRPELRDLITRIRERRNIGPLEKRSVPGPQATEAAEMVAAWVRLKNHSPDSVNDLKTLLEALGFRNVQISFTAAPESQHWLATCQSTPLGDRDVCIIPRFGSQAKGQYRILGLFDRPDEEAMLNLVRDVGGTEPILVLYFGRMTEQRRRDLAELCWERRRSFLTVDEALIFFLCGERFSRLPILFQCALPFTVAEPYTTTASLVPVEMFFGREQERRAVLDPYGTNLLYGGRQLGKSALLRDVERREHKPAQGRIVRWIDLKNQGIGIDRPAGDLWTVLGQELHSEKVLPRIATTHQTVVDRIKEWLIGGDDRCILLLLDEADAFLEADSRSVNELTRHSFPEVARLKGLMDDTNRRFKVVFAGLHNVQRAARDPNTPVGHLGTPVCIGPLLDNGEWRQARDLIEVPFRHMGYNFHPPDLWMRILSYTNYYPSLIQVFCKHLLEYLHNRDRTSFDFRTCPPYPISVQQIEEVYQSEGLQGEIRHKFELTLGLDERYRLIALCIALASIEQRKERALVDGFDVAWVREQALTWWPTGFATDSSYELFRTILDEMIGLGILRRAEPDRYALRSPNVLNLLGSRSQIEQKLEDVAGRPTPPSYEAASFRRSLNADCWTRSPLTAEQEASLIERANGVAILYGSQLSGLNDLTTALTLIPSQGGVKFAESVKQLKQLSDWLREVDKTRSELEGVTLAVVTPEARWSSNWVRDSVDFLRRKTGSTKRFLRVVFIADPDLAWQWCEDPKHSELVLTELSLRPWREAALRRWMEDAEFGPEAVNNCGQILDQTGGWGMLVHAIGSACGGCPHTWRDQLEEIRSSWPNHPRWSDCCGLPHAVLPVLRIMADWGETMGSGDLASLAPQSDVRRILMWADRLSYVREVEPDRWCLDPLVGSAVIARG